jgi:hypothetical protein
MVFDMSTAARCWQTGILVVALLAAAVGLARETLRLLRGRGGRA